MTLSRACKGLLAAAVAVMLAAVPATADAASKHKPPKPFVNNKVVIQHSVGGIKLGDTIAEVNRLVHRKFCSTNGSCYYADPKNTYSVTCVVAATTTNGKARVVRIEVDASSSKAAVDALHTNRGIGIGSTLKQVKKAYPNAKSDKYGVYFGDPSNKGSAFTVTKGRVTGIFMQSVHVG